MTPENENLHQALSCLDIDFHETDYAAKGFHADIQVKNSADIREAAGILYEQDYFVGFVTACHTQPATQVLYQFARFDVNHRIMIRCGANENNSVPTISDIFHGADWHERETRDFFGITFDGHPNMAAFILDESDRDLAPLIKTEKKLKSVDDIFGREDADA
ncbi:MAG: NADH-quinone oxidoreductase subunit C [Desulfobacter sp.]